MRLEILFLSAVIFTCRCQRTRSISPFIVGGDEISIESAPYQVALLESNRHFCGGSILSCKFVITAAHCPDGVSVSALKVRAGSATYGSGGSLHDVIRVDTHPLYDADRMDYDASILTLRNLIKFDAARRPIQLPFLNEAASVGSAVFVTGWGLTQNPSESRMFLRRVEMTLVNQMQCSKAHSDFGGVTLRMICAEADGKDACTGDSGGPLQSVKSKKLIGIVSFGPLGSCAQNGIPGVYTRVAAIRPWIRKVVGF